MSEDWFSPKGIITKTTISWLLEGGQAAIIHPAEVQIDVSFVMCTCFWTRNSYKRSNYSKHVSTKRKGKNEHVWHLPGHISQSRPVKDNRLDKLFIGATSYLPKLHFSALLRNTAPLLKEAWKQESCDVSALTPPHNSPPTWELLCVSAAA